MGGITRQVSKKSSEGKREMTIKNIGAGIVLGGYVSIIKWQTYNQHTNVNGVAGPKNHENHSKERLHQVWVDFCLVALNSALFCSFIQLYLIISSMKRYHIEFLSSERNAQVVDFSILTWHPSNKRRLSPIMGHQSLPPIRRSLPLPPPPPPPRSLGKISLNSGLGTCPKSNEWNSRSCPSFESTLRMTVTSKTCHTPQRNKKNSIGMPLWSLWGWDQFYAHWQKDAVINKWRYASACLNHMEWAERKLRASSTWSLRFRPS